MKFILYLLASFYKLRAKVLELRLLSLFGAGGEQLEVISGRGEFVGTTKHDGSDAEQRADARRVRKLIGAGLAVWHGGPNRGAHWQDIQRRWGAALKRPIAKIIPTTMSAGVSLSSGNLGPWLVRRRRCQGQL